MLCRLKALDKVLAEELVAIIQCRQVADTIWVAELAAMVQMVELALLVMILPLEVMMMVKETKTRRMSRPPRSPASDHNLKGGDARRTRIMVVTVLAHLALAPVRLVLAADAVVDIV